MHTHIHIVCLALLLERVLQTVTPPAEAEKGVALAVGRLLRAAGRSKAEGEME